MTDEQRQGGGKPGQDGPMLEIAGAAGGFVWLVAVLWWWMAQPEGQGPGLPMILVLTLAPLALLGALISTLRSLRDLRTETARLHGVLDAARAGGRPPTRPETRPAPSPSPGEGARPAMPPAAVAAEQPGPVFDDAEPSDLTIEDYLLALNFPDSPDDEEGIAALQMVLTDAEAARLIRAAQDVLTLLAQDGVFMDDLTPEPARADLWRRFAGGDRGPSTRGVGTVHDRAALTATVARLREDEVFRDAVHHFMRCFDRSLPAFGEYATDTELTALVDTRTVRAFLLVARADGAFD